MKYKLSTRVLSMLMAIIMMLSLTTSVFAADPPASAEPEVIVEEAAQNSPAPSASPAPGDDPSRLSTVYEGHRIHYIDSKKQPLPKNAELFMNEINEDDVPFYLQRAAHSLGLESCGMYLYFIADPLLEDASTAEILKYQANPDDPEDRMTVEVTLIDDSKMTDEEKELRLEELQNIHLEDLQVIQLGSYWDYDTILPHSEENGVIRFEIDKIAPFILFIPDWESAVQIPEEPEPAEVPEEIAAPTEDGGTQQVTEPVDQPAELAPVPEETVETVSEVPVESTADTQAADIQNQEPASLEEPVEEVYAQTVTASGADYSVSLTYNADANIPDGAVFELSELPGSGIVHENLKDSVANTLNTSTEDIVSVTFVDVDVKKDGESVTPNSDVSVSIEVDDSAADSDTVTQVVALGEKNEILNPDEDSAAYKNVTDSLSSTYAIVRITKQVTLKTSDDQTWQITVTYDRDDSAIPADVELVVNELKEGDPGYDEYIAASAAAAGAERENIAFAKAFDICLIDPATGLECQPTKEVSVSIQLLEEEVSDSAPVDVIHFGEEDSPKQLDAALNTENAIEFTTPGFSVFVIMQVIKEQILTASDGQSYKVTVTYDPDSGIPEDAALSVSELKEGDAGYADYVAMAAEKLGTTPENLVFARPFDITFQNPQTGEQYQPDSSVKVSVRLMDEDLTAAEKVKVLHFANDTVGEPEIMDATVNGETVVFETSGFSVYVLIGSGGETVTPQCTYTFYVPDPDRPGEYKEYAFKDSQGHTIYKQTITSGEELVVPQLTSTDTEVFAGWYEDITDGAGGFKLAEAPYDFDNITITENSAVDLYAVYTNYAMVIFHDQYDSSSRTFPVAYTRRAELVTTGEGESVTSSATIKISDLSATYTSSGGANMGFFGWSETPITTPGSEKNDEGNNVAAVSTDENGCIEVTGEKHLYPIFIETYLLTFYAAATGQGAAYNGPQYLNKGDYLYSLPTTSMSGKTFTGWFTGTIDGSTVSYGTQISDAYGSLIVGADNAGVYVSGGKLYLRADTTLYAGWTDDTSAEYRILYWQQNKTGADYTYVESIPRTGTVGNTVSVADADKANDRYTGFHLKEEPVSAVVKADGSTVLNVYYDHNVDYEPTQDTYTLTFADSVTEDGKISPNLPQIESVEAVSSLAGQAIGNPVSGRKGYSFSNWFLDPYCTQTADLNTLTMPDHDLTLYAGWEVEWYVVSIDPNYGELRPLNDQGVPTGTGSTYFWQTIEREPIAEYTYVERNYVASSSGTFYYVYHPGDGKGGSVWPDRYTYYTTDISKATEDTTFEYAPGTYTYAGWYEILDDGTEVPYVFGERTDHNTNLKLHWKKNGVYYLAYDAGDGTLEDGTKSVVLPSGYADYAELVLTQSAIAPTGYTFIGWQVRGSDSSVIYTPGQIFTLHADDAKRVSGKDIVYLDAVYVRVGTASITYDTNGGTVASAEHVDFGQVPDSSGNEWTAASGTVDTTEGTAIVSGLANNSKFKLSGGTGFTAPEGSNTTFLGWSDKDVCDDSATFYDKDSNVTYGVSDSTTLYAVWGAQVTYHLNSLDAGWGDELWDTTVYTKTGDVYSQTANLGTVISEPTNVPAYTGTDGKLFRYWATRTGEGTEESPYVYTENDFSQPVTGVLDLYAYWGEANTITVHAVDASGATLVDKTGEAGWTVTNVIVSAAETALNGTSHVTATPDNYAFAFATVAANLNSVSESNAVTAIKYENKKVLVKYKGESSFRVLDEGRELYFVYYQKKTLDIGYKSMEASGVLEDVTTSEAPTATNALLGEYTMSNQLTAPLSLATGFTNYAFAVGSIDSGTEMNASNLSLITNAVGADDPIPTLRVRNTWRGFEYTTETGDDAVWTSCGYAPQLYVIYYSQQPTVVMFDEKTVGTSAVMNTEFTFNLLVTATTTTTVSVQTQIKNSNDEWENRGEPTVTTTTGGPTTVFDTTASGNQPYILKNGEANSSILFYNSTVTTETVESGDTRTVTTTTTVMAQTAKITQTEHENFTTAITVGGTAYTDSPNVYTYTADGNGGTINVTFTNTHKSLPVEVHVAMVENDGTSGGIIQRDGSFRSTTEANYKFDLALGKSETLLTKLPSSAVFTGDTDTYAFGAVMSGIGAEGTAITVGSMGVASIAYEPISGNVYGMVLKDSDGNTISELGSNQLYYLYYPMPKIRYVKEAADGTLTDITGCLEDQQTGAIVPSDSVTYSHALLTMNGKTVEQNESFEIPLSGFVISQSGNNFRMPPVLDDGLYERYLSYGKLGAGSGGGTNSSELDVSTGLTMQLKVQNNTLQYSFDGTVWADLPLSGTPTIYAIYTERGYDFQISKTVDMSQSGENAIFSDASFTVTISSTAITKDSYDAEGAEGATVTATPADGTTPGTITLTVVDGTKVRIKGLGRGDYTVTEAGNENYTLTTRTGPIVGSSTSPMTVTDNTTVSFTLDTETKVDLTNSPKAICRIDDRYFYTLRSMVEYVDSEIATKTATAEMLTDYLIPLADTVEIPNGCDITLTTAESVGRVAVITRTDDLADVSLFTNNGTLTISNLTLEGSSVVATAPMIQSAGDLTVGSGATIQNVVGGGAINAIAGNITVSGTIQKCSAAEGGAIYHSGNSTITLNGTGTIQNNTATTDNGGAIYLAGGTVKVFGTSKITGNKAESGNGGAVYCPGTVVIEIDQGGSVNGNTAKEGGAIYAEIGTISISKTVDSASPAMTGNTATDGNGGAIHVGTGSVSVSGGDLSNNRAESGLGGAIYSDKASVTVSGTAEVKNNTAKEGGAVYAVSGAVTVSGGAVESNTATTGNGGAVYAGSGNVTVSGGSVSNNSATDGSGGAIYATSGNVILSDGASLSDNTAKTNGGAVYAGGGSVTVSCDSLSENTATEGKGGAVYAESGTVVFTGVAVSGNSAGSDGGAVYAGTGAVSVTDGSLTNNRATNGSGGAIYAESGNVGISNTAVQSNSSGSDGGAVYAGSGAVTLTGCETVTGNTAVRNGGAVCAGGVDSSDNVVGGTVTITDCTIGGTVDGAANTAANGGVVYAGAGLVSVTDSSLTGNRATSGNGGAVCSVSGGVTLSGASLSSNTAITGNGGGFYVDSGAVSISGSGSITNNTAANGSAFYMGSSSATLTAITVTGNTTTNGSTIFVNTGSATFSAGSITANKSTNGGAVGVGNPMARLYLSGNCVINNNTIGESTDKANIYLDQDAAEVITFTGLGSNARVGIYVPNKMITVDGKSVDVYSLRGVPGAVFATYSTDVTYHTDTTCVFNDRNDFNIQKDTEARQLYWGKAIPVEVRYLANYTDGFPAEAGTQVKRYDGNYYPKLDDGALSELANDIYNALSATEQAKIPASAAYGGAYLAENFNVTSFSGESYVTKIKWDTTGAKWTLEKFDGTTVDIGSQKLIIYYAAPAYISIENNTNLQMNISTLTVGTKSVINSDNAAGYGMTYAKNGAIREGLLPITADDLNLAINASVTLLIPGGQDLAYNLSGAFETTASGSVPLRAGRENRLTNYTLNYTGGTFTSVTAQDGTTTPTPFTGTTVAGTHHIIFGTDKSICKVIDINGEEHVFSKISLAIDFIKDPNNAALFADNGTTGGKVGVIEMLIDYLLPASDPVVIPRKYDITIKSSEIEPEDAEEGTHWYTPTEEKAAAGETRATLSRDSENTGSMVESYDNAVKNDGTVLRIKDLIIDGKSVRGSSDGGAVKTRYCNVYVDHVDFNNVYAGNGGALYVIFETDGKMVPGAVLEVQNSKFVGCNSTKATGSRLGGGAIHTSAERFTLTNCYFESCYAADQAGAVFHRVEGNYNSWTTISDCNFINCRAGAAGGLELDSKTITVTGTNFTNCVATGRNGGGFNAYMLNSAGSDKDSWITLTGCTFTNCQAQNYGGGFRSTGKYTVVESCTFTNCSTKNNGGGGIGISSGSAMGANIIDCTITGCTATNTVGGGIYYAGKDLTIGDSYNVDANGQRIPLGSTTAVARTVYVGPTSITGCVASKEGGGVYYDKGAGSFTMINATVTSNSSTTSTGGGLCIKPNNLYITGGAISNNTAKNQGGGIYTNAQVQMTISGTEITKNTSTNSSGGGVWYDGTDKSLTVNGCTVDNNTAPNGNGGGIYTLAKTVKIGDYTYTDANGDEQTKHSSISNNTSKNSGGGLYHNRNIAGATLTIINAAIDGNKVTVSGQYGGGIYTNAWEATIQDSSISHNTSVGDGGGLWYSSGTDANRNYMALAVSGSTIDNNTSNGSGGGIYTLAKTVTIRASDTKTDGNGKYIRSSISNNSAKNGGGVYQSRDVDGSGLTIANSNISGNTANNTNTGIDQGGGGIYAGVRTLTVTDSTVSNNTAKSHGGGILFEINSDNARNAMSLTVTGSTLDNNTSDGNGGGIYTRAKTVLIQANGSGDDAVPTKISNCTAKWCGGGVYQSRDVEGSALMVTGSTISGCVSNDTSTDTNPPRGGGGIFAYAQTITVTGSTISNNKAVRNGGGIDAPWEGNDKALIIDRTTVTGNSASNQGGGIYTRSQLTLRNGTEITGNRLTTNTAANCAGVYLNNNRTLFVGSEGAATDTIIVRGNTTANGTLSDLRLWDNGSENNSTSTYVYCSLSDDSEIRVVNAAKVSTWFGSAEIAYPNGFSDDNAVFRADSSTLHGIIDRTDPNGKKIIWAGPPIAKLTDGGGTLLYIRYTDGGALYPAIFDRLDTGNNSAGSTVSPFNMLRMSELTLYYADGTDYTGSDYCIKMLVEYYETTADMTLPYVEGRTVTFTTAGKSDADYPFEGKAGGRSTVVRAYPGSTNRSLMNINGDLILENIIIDGGTENGIAVSGSTRCMWIDNSSCTVTLGENAVLQNGKVNDKNNGGGGVNLQNGTLNIKGGVIRNCSTTTKDGGGVYVKNNAVLSLEAGSIYQCSANSGSGGGVRMQGGSFTMTGGTINGCSAINGGGVYLGDGNVLNMSGGSIINNSATKVGGGVAVYNANSRLYFSGKVNISGNTSDASVAKNKACNVELNKDSNAVINTNNGGLYAGSYIGVYVPNGTSLYDKHGAERKPFGTFATNDNTTTFYSFVNDRNGLKGGIIENPSPNTIYWIQIFSLEVSKEVISGNSTSVDPYEEFLFKVNIRENATVTGQLNAAQIDSDDGEYGEMHFDSNGRDTTTAVFALKDGESITGVNLSEGLTYEVIEYLTLDQANRYAAMPMNGYSSVTETLTIDGVEYTVIRANTYTSTIGENKNRSDVDPYTSSLTFSNLMPVCKITDMSGNILYRRYDWDKVTNKADEGQDGGSSTNQPYYYAPAVYTELTGDDGAFKALEGTLYTSNGNNPTSYSVSNGVQIQMLIADYSLYGTVATNTSKATLTTASSGDALFPKQDAGTTSTIRRAFAGDSMFSVTGDLTFATVILDGVKSTYTVGANGGIANVSNGGKLAIQTGAQLQNSRTAEGYSGGAVYIANGGTVTMTGGSVNHNESVGDGAGIYLAWDDVNVSNHAILNLSGAPSFGGTGTDVSGNITTTNGNFKTGELVAQLNGGKNYTKARQDIFIAGYEGDDGDTTANSLNISGNITCDAGTIWVWAEKQPHYKTLQQFAKYEAGISNLASSLAAFRNARPDDETGAEQVGQYLYGVAMGAGGTYDVYWYGINGSRRVILRKVGSGTYEPLSGAEFTISTSPGGPPITDRSGAVLKDLPSYNSGVFYIGELNYGTYYVTETKAPTSPAGYNAPMSPFIITVNDKGVGYSEDGESFTHEVGAA